MKPQYYRAKNIAGQDITLVFKDSNGEQAEVSVQDGETLDNLNENAMNFLWRYVWLGVMSVERMYGPDFKADWRREGF